MFPFRPQPFGSQIVTVDGTTTHKITLANGASTAMIDNRGSTDVLVEIGDTTPLDATSFRIPASTSQVLSVGDKVSVTLSLKRPSGSGDEVVYVCAGAGF